MIQPQSYLKAAHRLFEHCGASLQQRPDTHRAERYPHPYLRTYPRKQRGKARPRRRTQNGVRKICSDIKPPLGKCQRAALLFILHLSLKPSNSKELRPMAI